MHFYAYLRHALTRALVHIEFVLNLDFPRIERWLRRLRCPLGWLVLTAGIAAIFGAFGVPNGWLICGVLVVLMALGIIWPLVAISGLSAEIEFARRRCFVGDTAVMTVRLNNRWPISVWGLTVQSVEAPERRLPAQHLAAIVRVPVLCKTSYRIPVKLIQRGAFPQEPLFLVTGFPFGIFSARRAVQVRGEIIVRPRCFPLSQRLGADGNGVSWSGELSDAIGDEGSVCGARSHRDGEPLRRIHWAHSARRNTLIVCERQAASRTAVMVDVGSDLLCEKNCSHELREVAIRIAATVATDLLEQGHAVACRLGDTSITLPPGRHSTRQLLDGLALFDSTNPITSTVSLKTDEISHRHWQSTSLQISIRSTETNGQPGQNLPPPGKRHARREIRLADREKTPESAIVQDPAPVKVHRNIGEQICSQWNRGLHVNVV